MRKPFIAVMSFVICLGIVAGCSSDNKDEASRKRRNSTTSTTEKSSSTTKPAPSSPIAPVAFMSPAQIQTTWTEAQLCGLIGAEVAQKILAMATAPVPKYSYLEQLGARCSFSSGAGDEMYIEISSSTYKESREIDKALNAPGDEVVVSDVPGVKKVNSAIGTTYELNTYGESSNEWIINAPTEKAALELAKELVKSLA